MKIFFSLLLIVVLAFAAAPFLRPPADNTRPLEGLPWQVEPLADGSAKVFGLTLGRDSLGDARKKLGADMELAVVAMGDETGSLEMFYNNYRAGPFNGKLLLVGELDDSVLAQLRTRSGAPKYLDSGARKYHLQKDDLPLGFNAPIRTITFIPAASLDEETANKRFGPAERTIRVDAATVHLLYPHLGLDLMLVEGQKDVFQYIAPRNFAQLQDPLLKSVTPGSGNIDR